MKSTRARHLALLFACGLPGLAGCHHSHRSTTTVVTETVPVYQEVEPNDDALTANEFGVLLPGDFFYIDGFSTDDGSDPFDGFSFVSGQPIHVDFQLFHDVGADLDVWLYDAQLDEVVGYFETSANPERGGADITATGLEFHLLVTSFSGASSYSLEIDVTPLATLAASEAGAGGVRASAPAAGIAPRIRRTRAATEYVEDTGAARGPMLRIREEFEEETGLLLRVVQLEPGLPE